MNASELNARLKTALGSSVVDTGPLPVGFGLVGHTVRLGDGRHLAVKASGDAGPSLQLEGYMLGELARLSDLPVPKVYVAAPDLLVMEFIDNDGGGISDDVQRHAAELTAALHATPREKFGYVRDTLIGPLHQPNPLASHWVPFFRDHRLMHMARAAHEDGTLPTPLFSRIEHLAERIEDYLIEPPFPSLLHGDLWMGNVLIKGDRIAGFIDPAIYCGHPEIELAFTTMFGTFGDAFFEVYESRLPLEPGFHDVRKGLYNLYPALVHVRLFGSSYLAGIDRTLSALGF
jgi:fructosamine-3-kinase